MGWGQKRAHFICEVHGARARSEKILSDASHGLVVEAAGEYGMIKLRLGGIPSRWDSEERKRDDIFYVQLYPGRESEERGEPIMLAYGRLNYDHAVTQEYTSIVLNQSIVEAQRIRAATEALLRE